jgi:hypothetical protein
MKHLKDQRGVAFVLELVLVVAVLTLAGVGVYTATHNKKPQTAVAKSSTTPAASIALKSGLLSAQKIAFTYPSSWSLSNTSSPVPGDPDVSTDMAILTSPNGLVVQLSTGLIGVGGACGSACKVESSEPLTALDQNLYLNYQTEDSSGNVDAVMLADSPTCASFCMFSPTNHINGGVMYFYAHFGPGSAPTAHPLSYFLSDDVDMAAAKTVFESLKYSASCSSSNDLVITQWGVKLPACGVLAGMKYQIVKGDVEFYSPDLYPKYPLCGPGGIGALSRVQTNSSLQTVYAIKAGVIDGYQYYYSESPQPCVQGVSATSPDSQLGTDQVNAMIIEARQLELTAAP